MFSLYCNPDLDDCIYKCLLTVMAAMQAVDVRASFLFMGDLDGHHQEWLCSTSTNCHGVGALDFATVSGCDQLVNGPTHRHGKTHLLISDVTDLVRVAVVAPLGCSDHSSLSTAISMAQTVTNLYFSRRVLLKHRVYFTAVYNAIGEMRWRTIWSADNPVERLNVICLY